MTHYLHMISPTCRFRAEIGGTLSHELSLPEAGCMALGLTR